MSPLVIPIQTDRSDLLLKIDACDLANTFDDPADMQKMGTSEVCDVSLERVSDYSGVDHKALHLISHMLFDFITQNPDNIIYFYCDDLHDLQRSRKNAKITPQEYRSRLFSALFAQETKHQGTEGYIDDVISFEVDDVPRFIHLIYGRENTAKADVLKNAMAVLCAKP